MLMRLLLLLLLLQFRIIYELINGAGSCGLCWEFLSNFNISEFETFKIALFQLYGLFGEFCDNEKD